ncbi:MAG TPA: hypothetical protein VLV16_06140 [Gemmatimonadales bacterium]|nr:hypothetical protein [Gemmatimonadales bacterium]
MARSPFLVLLPTLFLAAPAATQLAFTPYVGAFLPAGRVVDETNNPNTDCMFFYFNHPPAVCANFGYVNQKVAPLVGARLTGWIRPRWALELGGFYTQSGTSSPTFGDQSATVYGGSARVLFVLTPHRPHGSLYALAGPVAVWHTGTTYDSLKYIRSVYGMDTKAQYWGAVFGVGVRGGTTAPVGWVIELEENYYGYPGLLTPQKQHDVVLSGGLRLDVIHSRRRPPSPLSARARDERPWERTPLGATRVPLGRRTSRRTLPT